MELPTNPWRNFSTNQRIIFILAILCFFGLATLAVMVLELRSRLQDSPATLPARSCQPSTLVLGATSFQIRNLSRGADGALVVPPAPSGVAYWIKGTNTNHVFVLSPTAENLAVVSTINLGSEAKATWSDCTFISYRVMAHEPGAFQASALPGQSQEGITVFFPIDASGAGFVFTAGYIDESVYVLDRPTPAVRETLPPPAAIAATEASPTEPIVTNPFTGSTEDGATATEESIIFSGDDVPADSSGAEVLAEIGLLEVAASADGENIILTVSIYNFGGSAFMLSSDDISLTEPDGTALGMIDSEPSLPRQIASTATETFTLTFPRPPSPVATLKILTVEYDIEEY